MVKEMKLLGFNFTKIIAEKNPNHYGKIESKSNLTIIKVEKEKLDLIKQEAAKISFSFSISYSELGQVNLEGFMIWHFDKKSFKDVTENWEKDIDPEIRTNILNAVLQKSSIQALKLEEQIGLPFHIQLPKVTISTPVESSEPLE